MNSGKSAAKTWASLLKRYGGAALIVVAAVGILNIPVIGKGLGTVLFVAVLLSAWLGGLGPGLFATLLVEFIAIVVLGYLEHDLSLRKVLELISFFGLGLAITLVVEALHVARRRVEAGHQWLSAVLSSIGDAVIATDDRGRVLFINAVAESLCGWNAAEAAGRPLADVFVIINEHNRAPVESPAARVLAEGNVVGLANHTILIARDGIERPIDDSAAPIRRADGSVEGVVLVFRDVTERRRAEAQLQEEARRKDEFLAILAHELRNPLAAIANATQILQSPGADGLQGWCHEVIDRQARQLVRLVDDLLDVSRISRGKIQLRTQRVELTAVIRSATEAIRPLLHDRQHDLRVDAPDGIALEADPSRLEQIVVNLLSNAAKYTEPGGKIVLSAAAEDGHAVIRVTDTGIGIAPDLLPRIFDLFIQGDRTPSRPEGGLGIGLTMVQKLVELHDGVVTVASDGPGLGSTFTVRLPRRPGETGSQRGDGPPAGVAETTGA